MASVSATRTDISKAGGSRRRSTPPKTPLACVTNVQQAVIPTGNAREQLVQAVCLFLDHYLCSSKNCKEKPGQIMGRFMDFVGTLHGFEQGAGSQWTKRGLMKTIMAQLDESRITMFETANGQENLYTIRPGKAARVAHGMKGKAVIDERTLSRLRQDQDNFRSPAVQKAIAESERGKGGPQAPKKAGAEESALSTSSSSSSSSSSGTTPEKEEEEGAKSVPDAKADAVPYLGGTPVRSWLFKSLVRDVLVSNPTLAHKRVGEIFCGFGAALIADLGLAEQVPLAKIVELAPAPSSIKGWLEELATHDEYCLANEFAEVAGSYILLDAGQKKQRDLMAFLTSFWDAAKRRVQLRFMEILPLEDKTSASAAKALERARANFFEGNTLLYGNCSDSAADMISALPKLLKPNHALFHASGCLLHVMNLCLATPCQLLFGENKMDERSPGQLAYCLSYLVLHEKEGLELYCRLRARPEMFFQVCERQRSCRNARLYCFLHKHCVRWQSSYAHALALFSFVVGSPCFPPSPVGGPSRQA